MDGPTVVGSVLEHRKDCRWQPTSATAKEGAGIVRVCTVLTSAHAPPSPQRRVMYCTLPRKYSSYLRSSAWVVPCCTVRKRAAEGIAKKAAMVRGYRGAAAQIDAGAHAAPCLAVQTFQFPRPRNGPCVFLPVQRSDSLPEAG